MSRDFELKFDAYKENNPAGNPVDGIHPDYYPAAGNIRNLAFAWPDGRMQFFNYSYLITCAFKKEDGSLLMEFSTHLVELKGQRLEALFHEIMAQANKLIHCTDKRYQELEESDKPVVHEINVTSKAE